MFNDGGKGAEGLINGIVIGEIFCDIRFNHDYPELFSECFYSRDHKDES